MAEEASQNCLILVSRVLGNVTTAVVSCNLLGKPCNPSLAALLTNPVICASLTFCLKQLEDFCSYTWAVVPPSTHTSRVHNNLSSSSCQRSMLSIHLAKRWKERCSSLGCMLGMWPWAGRGISHPWVPSGFCSLGLGTQWGWLFISHGVNTAQLPILNCYSGKE